MSHPAGASGPQFRADRPVEHEAVRTTIVGGRPPGSGQPVGPIPRGIEVLVKKAAVDAAFRETLLRDRAAAATAIGLALDPTEALMLAAVPAAQLEAIIAQTNVPQEQRRTFLGHAAAAMVAIVAGTAGGCGDVKGTRPDRPEKVDVEKGVRPGPERPERIEMTKGERPDRPEPLPEPAKIEAPAADETSEGIGSGSGKPMTATTGMRADRPPEKPAEEEP